MDKKFLFIIIGLLVITSFNIFSQNLDELHIVGKGKFLPNELIDKNIKDANGEGCAGLIIISDLEGLTYDSYNGIVKLNHNPGRDFLFLSSDERVVTVYKTGYTPLKLILNELGIKLERGKVWQLKITGNKNSDLLPIVINTNPGNAEITIDNVQRNRKEVLKLNQGKHTLEISLPGFSTVWDTINVNKQSDYFSYKLRPLRADVKFNLNDVYQLSVDKKLYGDVSTETKSLPVGEHILILKKGNELLKKQLTIDNNDIDIFVSNRSKSGYILASSLLPGLGQIFSGRESIGILLLTSFTASSIYFITCLNKYNNVNSELAQKNNELNQTSDLEKQYEISLEINDLNRQAKSALTNERISIIIPIAIYLYNIIDAIFNTPTIKNIVITKTKSITVIPHLQFQKSYYANLNLKILF